MAAEAVKCHLFKSLCLFVLLFFLFFTFQNERSTVVFSMCYNKLNYYYITPFQNVLLSY
jgi:hypothetical protein